MKQCPACREMSEDYSVYCWNCDNRFHDDGEAEDSGEDR